MYNFDSKEPLPETIKDQEFLKYLPEDTEAACIRVQESIGKRLIEGSAIAVEMVVAIKRSLKLPEPYDRGATHVILNVIQETINQCGFASPEIVFQKLAERKNILQAASDSD